MIRRAFAIAVVALLPSAAPAAEAPWQKAVEEWRERADQSLRRDNGWLTLAGRYVMKRAQYVEAKGLFERASLYKTSRGLSAR